MNLNSVTLIGHVTSEPLFKQFSTESGLTKFTVATQGRRKNKEGQPSVEFHPIVSFGRLAEICRDYLHKGRLVYVSGKLKTSRWEDDKKVMHFRTEIVASDMLLLDKQQALVHAASSPAETSDEEEEVVVTEAQLAT